MLAVLATCAAAALLAAGCSRDESAAERIERLRASEDVEALAREAASIEPNTSRLAVRALGHIGPRAAPKIQAALADSRSEIREEAVVILPRVSPREAAGQLAAVVQSDPSPEVRGAAATTLGHMIAIDEMDSLLAAVEDPEPMVRQRAARAITKIIGREYELHVNGTPEERRQAVAGLRASWPSLEPAVRSYYKRPANP